MTHLCLVGIGKAHLHIIKQLSLFTSNDLEVTLLTPHSTFYFTEMFPGLLENIYEIKDLKIDILPLLEDADIQWIEDSLLSVDPAQKKLLTTQGHVLSFDLLSFNLDSIYDDPSIFGLPPKTITMDTIWANPEHINTIRESNELTILGNNLLAFETAFSLQKWRQKHQYSPLTLVYPSDLIEIPSSLLNQLLRISDKHHLTYQAHNQYDTDHLLPVIHSEHQNIMYLNEKQAPLFFTQAHLPTDTRGNLLIEPTLQVKAYPYIFAAGRYTYLTNQSKALPQKWIEHQQATILWDNIKGYVNHGEGYIYQPKHHFPYLISIGNKKSYILYKKLMMTSHLAWLLQDRFYKKFINTYRHGKK